MPIADHLAQCDGITFWSWTAEELPQTRDRLQRLREMDAMLFGALAYVLAPWEDRVYTGNWRRARTVIDERGKIEALIGA